VTVGSDTGYSIGAAKTVMSYNEWTPITGTIANGPQYDLFGFDAAVTEGAVSITVNTNLSSYSFSGLTVGSGNPNFTFEGFQTTDVGEYFTGFQFASEGSDLLPGMTDVQVGKTGTAPEPATAALLSLALSGLIVAPTLRRR
jgi:hypothetical protein